MTKNTRPKQEKPEYKTIRIHKEDWENIREMSFWERKTIGNVVSEAVKLKRRQFEQQKED